MQELSSSEGFPYNSCSLPSWEAHAKFLLALFTCPSTGPSHCWESQDWSLSLFSIPSISTEIAFWEKRGMENWPRGKRETKPHPRGCPGRLGACPE